VRGICPCEIGTLVPIFLFRLQITERRLTHYQKIGTIVPILPLERAMAEPISALLAAEVRSRRGRLGLTQQDLADMAGVSERFVRFVEQGKPSIQLDSLMAVLETLGLELRLTARPGKAAHTPATQSTDGGSRP
jgi:y4mF family transcriptional regulator